MFLIDVILQNWNSLKLGLCLFCFDLKELNLAVVGKFCFYY